MNSAAFQLQLPPAPSDLVGAVKAWSLAVVMPTYEPAAPDRNPMFLENRVYQGSSGRVYPLPMIDAIATTPHNRAWQALHLENEYIRLMVLPEIGGRIHVGLDKTSGYDFFYRQNVIKPALVGLAGPWVSGGVEFNWPQHHRPATFMPVEWCIEEHDDGARTLWLGDHDPLTCLKGMHGVCLRPGTARVELKVRLFNRTVLSQTFLWWANAAVHVHEQYQSFFPPDVHFVADHARRAWSTYPHCRGTYYGVDYARRRSHGIAPQQRPARFVPPADCPSDDLRWYANIPVPTSYMAVGSRQDFSGGYDHARQAGVIHIADHHIAPGKKQWTWGNHDFGYAWDRHLTDSDGPYMELMAGVFTDNQPDFSFLAPGETRSFTQYWYPIQKIGPAIAANQHAALSLRRENKTILVGILVTRHHERVTLLVKHRGKAIYKHSGSVSPAQPVLLRLPPRISVHPEKLELLIHDARGDILLHHCPDSISPHTRTSPPPASEPPMPEFVATNDELYLVGLHLEQYRHATRYPEIYWREALRRDPGDCRCLNAIGSWHLKRGEFKTACQYFQRAIARLTGRNANPLDGEPFYNLGIAQRFLGNTDAAYDAFYKATWNQPWQAAAYLELAAIDCSRGNWTIALEHLNKSLVGNSENLSARDLKVVVLGKLNRTAEAQCLLDQTLQFDMLSCGSRLLRGTAQSMPVRPRMDVALNFARAGLWDLALAALSDAEHAVDRGVAPMVHYYRGYFHLQLGRDRLAARSFAAAAGADSDWCFPSRLEEILILQAAIAHFPEDGLAHYYLGNLLYDRKRHQEAIRHWQKAARLRPGYSVIWRNLGIGYFNVLKQPSRAAGAYRKARRCNPADARLVYEQDQLAKRLGISGHARLSVLEAVQDAAPVSPRPAGVASALPKNGPAAWWSRRDDLAIEYCTLLNQAGRHAEALDILTHRSFQPWEGGEGRVLQQYVRANIALGRNLLRRGMPSEALHCFNNALKPPETLGEARHPLAACNDIYFYMGEALAAAGRRAEARTWWHRAAAVRGDFQRMAVTQYSEMTFYSISALHRLGRARMAAKLVERVRAYATRLHGTPAGIDYFATSLPDLLLFTSDLQAEQKNAARFLRAQMYCAQGDRRKSLRLLRQVLQQDCNYAAAAELLVDLNGAARTGRGRKNQDKHN